MTSLHALPRDLLPAGALDYVVVDVFVGPDEQPFSGNPLAVVLGADELSTEQCQALAVEFHLSETVFPMRPTAEGADYRARIFTISNELPFAGHPSVGVAWVLARLGQLAAGPVTQQCGVGLVALDVPAGGGPVTLTGPPPVVSAPIDPEPLLAALSLTAADLAGPPARSGGSGIPFAFLSVRPEALLAARPHSAALTNLSPAVTGVVAFAVADLTPGAPIQVRTRVFAGDIGEDPATGSAALGFGGWLVASGLAAADGETAYTITQGVEMGRPSQLTCQVTTQDSLITRVRVSGRVVAVAKGRIRVPSLA